MILPIPTRTPDRRLFVGLGFIGLLATATLFVFPSSTSGQGPIPRMQREAALWLTRLGNEITYDEKGNVVAVVMEVLCEPFVVGDLDVFPQLESLTFSFVDEMGIDQFSGAARLTALKKLRLRGGDIANNAVFRAIDYFPNLEELELAFGQKLTDLSQLAHCQRIKKLTLDHNYELDMGSLAKLPMMANIEELVIDNQDPFTDDQFKGIAVFPNLRALKLQMLSNISDRGLKALQGAQKLESLEIFGLSDVDGSFLKSLTNCPLRRLVFTAINLRAENVEDVAAFPLLEELSISQSGLFDPIEPGFLKNVSKLKSLELSLRVSGTSVLDFAGRQSNLESLRLRGVDRFLETDFEPLLKLPNLRVLDIANCGSLGGTKSLELISRLHSLTSLHVSGLKMRDADWTSIGTLSKLKNLELSGASWLTDSHLQIISKLTNLESLQITAGSRITDQGLAGLAELKMLESLVVSGLTGVTGRAFESFAPQSPLVSLDLSGCKQFSVDGAAAIAKLNNLESLYLNDCLLIEGHLSALKNMPKLKRFSAERLGSIDPILVRQVMETWPSYSEK